MIDLLDIFGFSARFTGGGAPLNDDSLLISPDLLGGGGEGGGLGDFLESRRGVLGRLGIRKCLGEEPPEDAERGASVDR